MAYPLRRFVLAFVVLIGFGFARIPIERNTERLLRAQGFRDWSPNMSAREELTQASFVGSIGGFRSLVASVYDLRAHQAFREKDWASVEKFRRVTTSLQPRFSKHWDLAAWDMAWNAYAFYRSEAEQSEDEIESWQIENIIMPRYLDKGMEFAKQGAEWIPESYRLPMVIADIYSQKYDDHVNAAEWYLKASGAADAPPYIFRAYATQLAKCEGKEEEAYRVIADLYRSGKALTLTVRRNMERLEDRFALKSAKSKSLKDLEDAALGEGATYLDYAALGMHLLKVQGNVSAAVAAYGDLARDKEAPVFYKRKWALLLARDPKKADAAYKLLKQMFQSFPIIFRREDLIELADLESRLSIPEEEQITRKSTAQ